MLKLEGHRGPVTALHSIRPLTPTFLSGSRLTAKLWSTGTQVTINTRAVVCVTARGSGRSAATAATFEGANDYVLTVPCTRRWSGGRRGRGARAGNISDDTEPAARGGTRCVLSLGAARCRARGSCALLVWWCFERTDSCFVCVQSSLAARRSTAALGATAPHRRATQRRAGVRDRARGTLCCT